MTRLLSPMRLLAVASALLAGCASLPLPPPAPDPVDATATQPAESAPVTGPEPPTPAPQPAEPPAPEVLTIQQRFAAGMAQPDCHEVAAGDSGPFTAHHVEQVLQTRGDVFNFLLDEMLRHGLPSEFAVIPLIESGYRPDPGNRGAVRGLWQFTTGTGRHFGLRILPGWDERLSAPLATAAAIRHLDEMWQRWGDWRLAAIGFNAGEYAVKRALDRHPELAHAPERLGLPRNALTYVRRTRALACMIAQTPELATPLERWSLSPLRTGTGWRGHRDPARIATALDIDEGRLRLLNPLIAGAQWSRLRETPLLLPATAVDRLAQVISEPVPTSEPDPLSHRVRSGDSLWRIARDNGLSVKQLLNWNHLDPNIPLRIGQLIRLAP